MTDDEHTFSDESAAVAPDTVTVLSGTTFALSWPTGDFDPSAPLGFFCQDSRLLSRWVLDIDGQRPQRLTHLLDSPWRCRFVARIVTDPLRLLVERDRYLDSAMREDIVIRNLDAEPANFTVTVQVGVDFASLFAVKESRVGKPPKIKSAVQDGALVLSRTGGSAHEQPAAVRISAPGAELAADRLTFRVQLDGRAEWRAKIHVRPVVRGEVIADQFPDDAPVTETAPARRERHWEWKAAEISCSDALISTTLRRSRSDLGSLRIFQGPHEQDYGDGDGAVPVVAAGSPWFMTLFGRDSLLASYMALPLDPTLAPGVLAALARRQGTTVVAATEEQPGRILHEVRFERQDHLEHGGKQVYYGSVDSTPLFVALIGEYARWHGRCDAVEQLLPAADRALRWIDEYGDSDGDGFVEYERMTPDGLVNQGWKDSWDGVNFADGSVATAPIALCEVQGYVHAAFRARATLADLYADPATAAHWRDRAATLKKAFNERFWLPDRGYLALGLDHDKRPIDSLTSNMGQALWTGIVSPEFAPQIADRLLSPEMFTGWGIRTLASTMGAYDPLSYHNGSVWPHDNALIAYGLVRHGFVDHAQRVARGILDAANAVSGRLPELFAGLARSDFPSPVPYPTACSPQAWAAAAPVHLVRALLGLEPRIQRSTLRMDPHLPAGWGEVVVSRLPLDGRRIDIRARGHQAEAEGLPDTLKWVLRS